MHVGLYDEVCFFTWLVLQASVLLELQKAWTELSINKWVTLVNELF